MFEARRRNALLKRSVCNVETTPLRKSPATWWWRAARGRSMSELPDDQSVVRPADITLYFAPASRAFTPRWLLEELELPYNVKSIDLRRGIQKSAQFRAINPMGKVPAL